MGRVVMVGRGRWFRQCVRNRLEVSRHQILEGLECQAREFVVQAEEPLGGF